MLKLYCVDCGELKESSRANLKDALWIDAIAPSNEEVELLNKEFKIQLQDVADCLDPNERSRVEIDEDYDLLVLRSLITNGRGQETAQTMPIGIFATPEKVITVRIVATFSALDILADFKRRPRINNVEDLFLALIRRMNRDIDRRVRPMEGQISSIQKSVLSRGPNVAENAYKLNSELIILNTALLSNYNAVSMLSRAKHLEFTEDQSDLLEDLENDVAQLYDMTTIYREIVSNVLRAHESAVSNSLSTVMKTLTVITLTLMLPTLIASLYGMNIGLEGLPFFDFEFQFWVIIAITAIAVVILWVVFRIKKIL